MEKRKRGTIMMYLTKKKKMDLQKVRTTRKNHQRKQKRQTHEDDFVHL